MLNISAEYSCLLCLDSISDWREHGIASIKDFASEKRLQQVWPLRLNPDSIRPSKTVISCWLYRYRLTSSSSSFVSIFICQKAGQQGTKCTSSNRLQMSCLIRDKYRVPVNSSHGQLITAQNRMTSWPAAETPCCDELTGASNAVLSLLWRVNRMLLSA